MTDQETSPRGPHRWSKGESGNPAGRPPRGQSLNEALRRRYTPEQMVELAARLAETAESEQVRLAAIQEIQNRAYGKIADKHEHAMASPDHDVEDDGIDHLDDGELAELEQLTVARNALLARGRARREQLALPAPMGPRPVGVGGE